MCIKHYKEIDLLRGIAIILVLIGHAIILYPINLHEIAWCNVLFTLVCSVHMPLFYFISGFCYFKGKGYREYIKKKVKRLLVPYIFWGLTNIFVKVLFSKLVNNQINSISEGILDLICGKGLWFLYTLFLIFLIFPVFEKMFNKSKIFLISIEMGLIIARLVFNLPEIFCIDDIIKYLFYFILGFNARRNYKKILEMFHNINKTKGIVISSILLGIFIGLFFLYNMDIFTLLASFAGVFDFYLLAKNIEQRGNRLLLKCSKYSLPLYLFNGYFLGVTRIVSVSVLNITNPLIIICLNMLTMLGLSIIISEFLITKIPVFKFLCGMS